MEAVFLKQLVGHQVDSCQLEQLLSRGQLYATYQARQLPSNQPVMFTLLLFPGEMSAQVRQQFRAQFLREAAALVEMHHPHLVSLDGYGEWEQLPYLIMPSLAEESLATLLGRRGACTPAAALLVLEQVTAGLEYAHCRRVVHGALMLSHLLVLRERQIGIMGIGLPHLLHRYGMLPLAEPYKRMAAPAGLWPVHPRSLAPECVRQERVADIRSDVYSVGLLLSDLLTGTLSGRAAPSGEIVQEQERYSLPLPGQVQGVPLPRGLAGVLQRALAADPRERFRRVSELLAAFAEELAKAEPVLASHQQASSLLRAGGSAYAQDKTLPASPSHPWEISRSPIDLDASLPASGSKPWRQPKRLPLGRRFGVRGSRAHEPSTRPISRRHVLARLARGATLGALGVSGVSIVSLTTKALLKLPSSQSKGPLPPALNTAQIFTNPRDGRQDMLVRLPTGAVVAYDRACTHVGVYVNYDSKTHMLVCPAHGAIFDPAHGGRVVQCPATLPLPKVSIQVKSDGTLRESGEALSSRS